MFSFSDFGGNNDLKKKKRVSFRFPDKQYARKKCFVW